MSGQNSLSDQIQRLFIVRPDCFCTQLKTGSYVREDIPLGNDIIEKHLAGQATIGTYQLSKDGLVKWLCFDLDPEKLLDPGRTATKILDVCFEEKEEADGAKRPRVWRKAVLLEASRYPDSSYHVWILFEPMIAAKVASWLGLRILELSGLSPKDIEVFPKQTELTPDRPFGNIVKVPLGFHQVERKWSRVLNPATFEPLPNTFEDNQGISFSEADLARIMSSEKKTYVQASLLCPENFTPLNDNEEEEDVQFLCRHWVKGHRQELEMYFLGLCLKRHVNYESARHIIEEVTTRTNDEERTQRLEQVDYHYRNRLNVTLKGKSGILETLREIKKTWQP